MSGLVKGCVTCFYQLILFILQLIQQLIAVDFL